MLNRSAPYGQVYGMAGVSFEQNGRLFDFGGFPVDGNGNRVEAVQEAAPSPGIEGMHWKQLKVMVEQYGGEFTTREAAIAFLRGPR